MGILIRLAVSAVALLVATLALPGITVDAGSMPKNAGVLVLVAAIFGVVNAILRPIIKTVGCAFYVLTLGLLALVVNGLLLMLTSWIAGRIGLAFHVENFWPSAVVGALIVGLISWVLNMVVRDRD
jgi:putative membrane protein